MHILNSSGAPEHRSIDLRTRLNNSVENIQPWDYSAFEWNLLDTEAGKFETIGAVRVSGEPCPVYNCHGLTFASRRTQVGESSVSTLSSILEDDGYQEIPEPQAQVGDVVIYYSDSDLPEHSGIVIGRGNLNVPRIWSKWGKGHEWVHPLGSCTWGGMTTRFFRITKWKFHEVFKTIL